MTRYRGRRGAAGCRHDSQDLATALHTRSHSTRPPRPRMHTYVMGNYPPQIAHNGRHTMRPKPRDLRHRCQDCGDELQPGDPPDGDRCAICHLVAVTAEAN